MSCGVTGVRWPVLWSDWSEVACLVGRVTGVRWRGGQNVRRSVKITQFQILLLMFQSFGNFIHPTLPQFNQLHQRVPGFRQ